MKNQLILGFLILNSLQISSGQIISPIMKSAFLMGGSIFINYENENQRLPNVNFYHKNFLTGIDVYGGYFISNHISIGLLTNLSIKKSKTSNTLNDSKSTGISNNYSFGPFLRYYTKPGIFFEGTLGLGYQHLGYDDDLNWFRSFFFSTGVGYSLFITNSIALEPQIKYKYDKIYWSSEELLTRTNNGIYFSIGLQFYLPINK